MNIKYEYPAHDHAFTGKHGERVLTVRSVTMDDLDKVLELQALVKANMPNPDHLCAATREDIADSIPNDLCIGVFDGERIVAFTILIANRSCPGNLGEKFGFPAEECVTFEIVFVHPFYRGLGLQRFFLNERKKFGRELGAKRGFCTVSPENAFSLNNIVSAGFSIYKRVSIYGGLDRYLMMLEYEK